MKLPGWLHAELDLIGHQVLDGETKRADAAAILADAIFERDRSLARTVTAEFVRKQLRGWIRSHGGTFIPTSDDDEGGAQFELFTWLPAILETSPGRFARVGTMTGEDWDAALRQAEVKAGNAASHADGIRRAYDRVRPLLTEDAMTTADVAGQLGG